MSNSYAGIGSRDTPIFIQNYMKQVAHSLARKDFILRSGHAFGADSAFEFGCDKASGKKEIYLPWKNFNGSDSNLIIREREAYDIAEKFHPAWDRLSQAGKLLMMRNSYQILGINLDDPCNFVLCWTLRGQGNGGTGQALRIAREYDVPIFDFGRYQNEKLLKQFNKFKEKFILLKEV